MRKIGKKILLVFLDLILAAAIVGGTWSWNYLIPREMKVEATGGKDTCSRRKRNSHS